MYAFTKCTVLIAACFPTINQTRLSTKLIVQFYHIIQTAILLQLIKKTVHKSR